MNVLKRIQEPKPDLPCGLLGGHMPDPPTDCSNERIDFDHRDSRHYINTVFCRDCKNICQRRKEFIQEWKDYHKWVKNEHPTSS